MDLFEYAASRQKETESPLASRMRPRTLEEVVGQEHIIGKDKLLYRAIKADKLRVPSDQCHCCRKKRYGSGRGRCQD